MSSKFFTNEGNKSVIKKFEGVFAYMANLYAFHAVVGYFRSSGYFAIRDHLIKLHEVKILVGINVDHIAAEAQRRGQLFFGDEEKTRDEFVKWLQKDIVEARYSPNHYQLLNQITDNKRRLSLSTTKSSPPKNKTLKPIRVHWSMR